MGGLGGVSGESGEARHEQSMAREAKGTTQPEEVMEGSGWGPVLPILGFGVMRWAVGPMFVRHPAAGER